MDLASFILGAILGLGAIIVSWWMALSTRVRERMAQDEPVIDFTLYGTPTEGQRLTIENGGKGAAFALTLHLGDVAIPLPLRELRHHQGPGNPCSFGIQLPPVPRGCTRAVVTYEDSWSRPFGAIKALAPPDGPFIMTAGGYTTNHPPRQTMRQIWSRRHII